MEMTEAGLERLHEAVTGHAPIPWHAKDRGIGWEVHYGPARDDCYSEEPYCNSLTEGFRDTMTEADAKFVALAVNSHEALLEALENLVAMYDKRYGEYGDTMPARKVIAAARGEG